MENKRTAMRIVSYNVHARRWLSDLQFFLVEISFLKRLLADYFMPLTDDHYSCRKLRGSQEKLFRLENEISELAVQLQEHIHLIDREGDAIAFGEEALAARQVLLDVRVAKQRLGQEDPHLEHPG